MAKRLPDGNLLFLNRKDWMLKINGQRVEPGEIEHQIKAIKGVNEAVVKGFENSHSQTYLCAWYTGDITENELKFQLADSLSSYMMPAFIIKLDAFPINANGKLDRKALNAPDASSFLTTYEAPINELETAICNGFQKTLGMEQIGRNDDFFSLGGDSISAITLCSELKAYQLQSFHIFAGRTPKGIAAICCGQTADSLKSPQESYVPTALQLSHDLQEQESYLLTAGQTGIYYASINAPLDLSYNLPFDCKLPLETDIIQLRGAIEKVLHTFPAFGVRFQVIDGQPRMVKREPYIEIETRYAQEAETTEIKRHFIRPFDMEKGELARFMIVKTELALYLLADIHHIIFDGSSAKVLLSAISNAYMGEAITPEDISIFQAACMEENAVSTPAYSRAYEFFHKQLTTNDFEGSLPSDLPTNEQNEQNITGVGESVEYHFSEATDAIQIEHFARKNGITESTLFMGAFAWAFSKMTNTQNIGFCTAENGRPTAEYYNSIGMLVRTLPLSLSIDESLSAGAYLCEVSKLFYETIANDSYPFYKLAGEFGLNNDTMFVYQAEMLDNFNFNANPIQVEQLDTRYALSKLAVSVYKSKGRYKASITYRSDLYSINRIQTLCSLMQAALSGFVKGLSLKDIPLVSDADIQLLDSFHGKDTDVMESDSVAIPSTITDMLNHAIKLYPDNTAIVSGEKRLTYKELDEVTDRLAAYIVGQGIGREDVVAILADRDEMMVICPIAVSKAGAMYLPLDSSYPSERLDYMIQDSGAKLLILPYNLHQIIGADIEEFYTEGIKKLPKCDILLPSPSPNDAFVMLYTSGSTGKPKGCILEHTNFTHYCKFYHKRFNYSDDCAVAQYASFGFDASMMDTFATLSSGASLYIIPFDMRLDLHSLNRYLEANKITHIFMTTLIGRQFALLEENHSLKYLILGGEALAPIAPNANYTIANGYGPSETCCGVSFFDIDKLYKSVPLGKPNTNTKAYIVDKQFHRVPVGMPGELCIAGPQVSRGYINLPEKTAVSYINNPFNNHPKYNRIYKTGDIVCFLPDGNLQFVGRKDSQVKINGFRIELTAVEDVIRRFEGIKDATVTVFDHPNGEKLLVAYVVSDHEVDIEKLNMFIRSEKPAYMVPSVTMQIDKIPLTHNHKVNKRALPTPIVNSHREYIQPQNTTEEDLCTIMGETLNIAKFSAADSFFELGGSSISATKVLVSAMAKGYKITYADLFCHQSPRKIAEYLNLTNTHKNHDDIVQYDYSKIDKLISQSSIESIDDAISHNPSILNGNLGNLLLTGVTGFLGIHILHRFITSYTGNITCIIRKKDTLSTEERLKTLLFYYFSDDCAEAFENGRITVIEASINDNDLSDKLKPVDFDSVIHCAASVLHFASDDILYSNNVEGTVNLLKICEERKKRFIHISTGSIAGFKHEAQTKEAFTEHDLYIAQQIDNDYIRTKYLAERYLLEAALRGVDVKILRVGNLTNRLYDGEFQINFHTNGFMRNMRGVLALGHSSEELEDKLFNLSPIDCTAEAVLRIADSDVPNYIYHVYNDKLTKLSELTKAFQECGFPMRIVPETEYREQIAWAIQKYKGDDYMSDTIAGLIAYKDTTTGTELESVETSNEFTIQVLSRLGFIWPKIEMSYIKRMINIMTDMGFFEKYEKTLFDM